MAGPIIVDQELRERLKRAMLQLDNATASRDAQQQLAEQHEVDADDVYIAALPKILDELLRADRIVEERTAEALNIVRELLANVP